MGSRQVIYVAVGSLALAAPLSFGLGWRVAARSRGIVQHPVFDHRTPGTTVSVRRLMRTGASVGRSENSLDPRLQLLAEGVAFHVFKADLWPFAEIAEIDAPWAPFGMRLSLRHNSGARLTVDLADRAKARALLRALPPDLAFTRRALNIRDWIG